VPGSLRVDRTYNPPVNSCTGRKTANYRQVRLFLKTQLLRHFHERLSAANSEEDSLKKSPKYFSAPATAPTGHWTDLRCDQPTAKPLNANNNAPCQCLQHRHDANQGT
jgi:hypothetical protein